MLGIEHHLTAEIEFWKELIDSQDDACEQATLERMKQALALAERKLLLLDPAEARAQRGSGMEH